MGRWAGVKAEAPSASARTIAVVLSMLSRRRGLIRCDGVHSRWEDSSSKIFDSSMHARAHGGKEIKKILVPFSIRVVGLGIDMLPSYGSSAK